MDSNKPIEQKIEQPKPPEPEPLSDKAAMERALATAEAQKTLSEGDKPRETSSEAEPLSDKQAMDRALATAEKEPDDKKTAEEDKKTEAEGRTGKPLEQTGDSGQPPDKSEQPHEKDNPKPDDSKTDDSKTDEAETLKAEAEKRDGQKPESEKTEAQKQEKQQEEQQEEHKETEAQKRDEETRRGETEQAEQAKAEQAKAEELKAEAAKTELAKAEQLKAEAEKAEQHKQEAQRAEQQQAQASAEAKTQSETNQEARNEARDQAALQKEAREALPQELHPHLDKMEITAVRSANEVNREWRATDTLKKAQELRDSNLTHEERFDALEAHKAQQQEPYKPGTMVVEGRLTESTKAVLHHDMLQGDAGKGMPDKPILGRWLDANGDVAAERTPDSVPNTSERLGLPDAGRAKLNADGFVETGKDYESVVRIESGTQVRLGEVNPYQVPVQENHHSAFQRDAAGDYVAADGRTIPANVETSYQFEVVPERDAVTDNTEKRTAEMSDEQKKQAYQDKLGESLTVEQTRKRPPSYAH